MMGKHTLATIVFTLFLISIAPLAFSQAGPSRAHDPAKTEVLTLPLLPEGFVSSRVTVSAGKYVIHVPNHTGVRGLRFEIDRMPGISLNDAPSKHEFDGPEDAKRSRFVNEIVLNSGTYRVRVVGRPRWACAITVR